MLARGRQSGGGEGWRSSSFNCPSRTHSNPPRVRVRRRKNQKSVAESRFLLGASKGRTRSQGRPNTPETDAALRWAGQPVAPAARRRPPTRRAFLHTAWKSCIGSKVRWVFFFQCGQNDRATGDPRARSRSMWNDTTRPSPSPTPPRRRFPEKKRERKKNVFTGEKQPGRPFPPVCLAPPWMLITDEITEGLLLRHRRQ